MDYFKSIGIVASIIILAVFTIAFMYFTYIIAIGLLILALIFIVKFLLGAIRKGNSLT